MSFPLLHRIQKVKTKLKEKEKEIRNFYKKISKNTRTIFPKDKINKRKNEMKRNTRTLNNLTKRLRQR